MTHYKGYATFNSDHNRETRTRNQGVVMANIFEDNVKERVISAKGGLEIIGYFNKVAKGDRELVLSKCKEVLESRGFMYE